MKMKKALFRTAATFFATVLFLFPVQAAPTTSAHSAILMDADTGRILYACNIDRRALIASTTKIMTALVVLEHCALDEEYIIPAAATGIEGSSLYLKAGERLTIRELLYGMMLHSGNDAAVALALACSDDVAEFVALMNLKAQRLDLKNTHFDNPNGLDSEENYSTAEDIARLTAAALKNETFLEIVSTRTITLGSRTLINHNRLLWSLEGAIGVKTGYTRAAGRILVSAAQRGGRRLIAVTFHDSNDWADHAALYAYGFSRYEEAALIRAGDAVAQMPMLDGTQARLLAAQDFSCPALPGDRLEVVVLCPRLGFLRGAAGEEAALAAVRLGDRTIGWITLNWEEENREGTHTEDSGGAWADLPPSG